MTAALAMLLPFASDLLKKLFPDPLQQAELQLRLAQLVQTGELAELQSVTSIALGQAEINKIEAASTRLFVAGWRPAVGWVCVVAFGFKFVGGPLLVMGGQAFGVPVTLPAIETGDLLPLLVGLLGLGSLRTVEKVKGVA